MVSSGDWVEIQIKSQPTVIFYVSNKSQDKQPKMDSVPTIDYEISFHIHIHTKNVIIKRWGACVFDEFYWRFGLSWVISRNRQGCKSSVFYDLRHSSEKWDKQNGKQIRKVCLIDWTLVDCPFVFVSRVAYYDASQTHQAQHLTLMVVA